MFWKDLNEKQKLNFKPRLEIAWSLDFHGGKLLPLRTLWRNLNMFLYTLEFKEVEKKKKKIGKKYLKKTNMCPKNYFKKKVQKLKQNKNKKTWKRLKSLADSEDRTKKKSISETIFSKQFCLNIFFSFLFSTQGCLETCGTWITKCVTA